MGILAQSPAAFGVAREDRTRQGLLSAAPFARFGWRLGKVQCGQHAATHLRCRFARERNRDHFFGCGHAREQYQKTLREQRSLPRARSGFDNERTCWIEGCGARGSVSEGFIHRVRRQELRDSLRARDTAPVDHSSGRF